MVVTILLISVVLLLSTGEGVGTAVAGFIAPFMAQWIKKKFGASGGWALAITVAVSAVVAVGAMFYAGELHTFGDVVQNVASVFGVATIVYKLLIAPAPASS